MTGAPMPADRAGRRLPWRGLALLALVLVVAFVWLALPPEWASDGLAWVRTAQGRYQLALKDAVVALKQDHPGMAALTLGGLSFLYGVLHAVGPGHGKAVIGTYAVANLRQVRRAVVLSFGAGLVQALSAIALVSAGFLLFAGGTRWATQAGERYLEPASYALIAALGAWLAVRSAWPWLNHLVGRAPSTVSDQDHGHHHGHHHGHDAEANGDSRCCGHDHLPSPTQVEAAGSWRQIAALSVAVGLRPCTGAILVLILSFSLELWGAGVAAALCMGLGTAITVSVLAVLASTIGKAAVPAPGTGRATWPRLLGIVGGGLILTFGLTLFLAAVQTPAHPLL